MNNRLVAMISVDAMAPLDWVALVLCAYIVGLQVCGEVKDTALCEMAAARGVKELSPGWQLALGLLNRLRSQLFLAPLMGCIPTVILVQGGSALSVCFNTIAVLFITGGSLIVPCLSCCLAAKTLVSPFTCMRFI
jgi:hypothetical protein